MQTAEFSSKKFEKPIDRNTYSWYYKRAVARGARGEHLENYIVQKIEEETRSKFEGASARGSPCEGSKDNLEPSEEEQRRKT